MHDVNARTSTAYYETWGQLLNERENATRLRLAFERAKDLVKQEAISIADYERAKYDLRGTLLKIRKLTEAVDQLRQQVESAQSMAELGSDQLRPLHAKIATLKSKRERLRAQIAQGRLRSPVNGTVLRRNTFVGERCELEEPIVTVVEETSARVIMYYSQHSRVIPEEGDTVTVSLPPRADDFPCTVERVGKSFETPPEQIARHYFAEEKLLPIRMKPAGSFHDVRLRLGAVVMLPRDPSRFLQFAP